MTNNQSITLPLDKLIEYIQSAYYEGINESIDNSMIDEEIDDYFLSQKQTN